MFKVRSGKKFGPSSKPLGFILINEILSQPTRVRETSVQI